MALFEAQPPRPGQRPGRSFPVSSHSVSQAEESDGPDKKRRRVQRACDMCRLKKVRCEGGSPSRKACNNCINGKYDCTYVQTAKVEARDKAYVQSLEARLVQMEELLRKFVPDANLSRSSVDPKDSEGSSSFVGPHHPPSLQSSTPPVEDVDSDDEELTVRRTLEEKFKHISLDPGKSHFVGKSSSLMFIQTALESLQLGEGSLDERSDRGADSAGPDSVHFDQALWSPGRSESSYRFSFPEDDLMQSLFDTFFRAVNFYFPLLHRPTFTDSVADGLHLRDEGFGSVVLLVCALGARFSHDPRVYTDGRWNPQAAGWQWFNQVQATMKVINMDPPRLYDLQIAFLASLFLHGIASPQSSWPVIGIGIRLAQAIGAHRRKVYSGMHPVQGEQMKRAFWLLIKTDRELASALGRPSGTQDEDFDLDFPVECDDEYWTNPDPDLAFKQPADKPSTISFFNCSLRLSQIAAFATRTIYSTSKSKTQQGHVGAEWEERTVMELDSALNAWVDSIPEHLRWDPDQKNFLFMNQSVLLYSSYYSIQIGIHRPFLSNRRATPVSFPSLAICTNAARSCLHILEVQYIRAKAVGGLQTPQINGLFVSGMVLLMSIWGSKRSGQPVNMKDVNYIHKAIEMLKALEPWWNFGGRMAIALYELMRAGDLPVPEGPEWPDAKVPKNESREPSEELRSPAPTETSTNVRSTESPASSVLLTPAPTVPQAYAPPAEPHRYLPVRSEDLGRQPMHFEFNTDVPAYSTAAYGQPMPANGAWHLGAIPQNMQAPMIIPEQVNPDPQSSDGFLRALAAMSNGDPNQFIPPAQQSMSAPAAMPAGGESVLGMWTTVPGTIQWDEWGNYFANLPIPDPQAQQWQGR